MREREVPQSEREIERGAPGREGGRGREAPQGERERGKERVAPQGERGREIVVFFCCVFWGGAERERSLSSHAYSVT